MHVFVIISGEWGVKMEFRDLKKQYEALKSEIDEAISNVLHSSSFISGPWVKELELQLAEYVGVKHCITCANGTDALTLALMAWEIGAGDAVFVPDFTFFASGESPAFLGATPIYVDVDKNTYNMDPDKLEAAILRVKEKREYVPRVVITVDLFGQPADYLRIKSTCEKYDLLLLEDGAQGFGGSIDGQKSCSFGDISTTSFFPAKPLGCYGDGGAVFTNRNEWAEIIRSLAVHGKNANDKYDNIRIGMNSRLDSMQAAVLQVKLKAFQEYELESINEIAEYYTDKLQDYELILPSVKDKIISSWAQYTIQIPKEIDRDVLQKNMKKQGIPTMVYYKKPMHVQSAFINMGSGIADCPITGQLCETVLSLPIHPYLTKGEMNDITDSLKGFIYCN